MQVGGTSSSSAAGSNITFGSLSKPASSLSDADIKDQLKLIQAEVVRLKKALEEIHNPLKLQQGADEETVMSKVRAGRIADSIKELSDAFSKLFDDKKIKSEEGSLIESYRSQLRAAVSGAFGSTSSNLSTDFGINFNFNTSLKNVLDFTSINRNELVRQLTTDGSTVNEFFFGKKYKDDDGFLEKILQTAESVEADIEELLGPKGIFVDTKA
ncbi:MAG: hypothetical protein HY757_03290 [Nitrospirae bacterium]|nr:hypothetical protein [Nitrospirota bacterium]